MVTSINNVIQCNESDSNHYGVTNNEYKKQLVFVKYEVKVYFL